MIILVCRYHIFILIFSNNNKKKIENNTFYENFFTKSPITRPGIGFLTGIFTEGIHCPGPSFRNMLLRYIIDILKWHLYGFAFLYIIINHNDISRYIIPIYHDISYRYIMIYHTDISWYITPIYHDISAPMYHHLVS